MQGYVCGVVYKAGGVLESVRKCNRGGGGVDKFRLSREIFWWHGADPMNVGSLVLCARTHRCASLFCVGT
jgi:hypothetical protein